MKRWKRIVTEDEFLGYQVLYAYGLGAEVLVAANAQYVQMKSQVSIVEFTLVLEILQVTKFAWQMHRSLKETGQLANEPEVEWMDV